MATRVKTMHGSVHWGREVWSVGSSQLRAIRVEWVVATISQGGPRIIVGRPSIVAGAILK